MGDRRAKRERRKHTRPNSSDRRHTFDRRRKTRYRVREGAYAALTNSDPRLGQIRDISMVGLSFRYIGGGDSVPNDSVLKIILAGRGLMMDGLPYYTVSDYEIESEYALSSLTIRQMHLAFGELSSQQRSKLDAFILNYSMGEA